MLTEEQLRTRQLGVSGSEAAALVGLSRWAAPIDIYQAKIDPVQTQRLADMESPLIRGILFEEPVIKWYSIITGRSVTFPGTLQHPKHKRTFATPDGIATLPGGDTRVLEVKNSTWMSKPHWGDAGTDQIDSCYLPQVMFEMACAQLPKLDLCLYMGMEPVIYHVDFDEDTFEALREVCDRFYTDHVIPRRPPPPDASDSYAEWIARMHPRVLGTIVDADEDTRGVMTQLVETRAKLKELEAEELLLKNLIKERIGDGEGIRSPEARITWRRTKDSPRVDWKGVANDPVVSRRISKRVMDKYSYTQEGHRRFLVTEEQEK